MIEHANLHQHAYTKEARYVTVPHKMPPTSTITTCESTKGSKIIKIKNTKKRAQFVGSTQLCSQ